MLRPVRRFRHAPACFFLAALLLLAGCRARGNEPAAAPPERCGPNGRDMAQTVHWIEAAPPAQLHALADWCATVGPPALAAAPAAPPPAPPTTAGQPAAPAGAADSLAVISWNVHVGGGSIERLVADLRAGRLTGGHPPAQFVLLLQEAYRAGDAVPALPLAEAVHVPHRIAPPPPAGERVDVVQAARVLGLSLLYVPSMRNGPGMVEPREDRGNAILSTLPLQQPAAMELPLETERRVPVAATVAGVTGTGAPWRLRLVAAHLDHRAGWRRPLASFGAARLEQARALAGALKGGEPLVIGSDLNTWSAAALERAVPYLRRQFPSGPPEPRGATFTLLGVGRRLDHLFFRLPGGWHVSVRILPDRYGSDHNPLLASVRFADAPPAASRLP